MDKVAYAVLDKANELMIKDVSKRRYIANKFSYCKIKDCELYDEDAIFNRMKLSKKQKKLVLRAAQSKKKYKVSCKHCDFMYTNLYLTTNHDEISVRIVHLKKTRQRISRAIGLIVPKKEKNIVYTIV